MDLLGENPPVNLSDPNFKVYSRNRPLPPCFIDGGGSAENSLLTAGCEIYGKVVNSILSEGVYVGKGSVIENSIIMRGTRIGNHVSVKFGIIDEYVSVEDKVKIGDAKSNKDNIALIGRGITVKKGGLIAAGEIVEEGR